MFALVFLLLWSSAWEDSSGFGHVSIGGHLIFKHINAMKSIVFCIYLYCMYNCIVLLYCICIVCTILYEGAMKS